MSFRPCLLVPIFNHDKSIIGTVDRLAAYGLPIFIVDDGSNEPTQEALAALASKYAQVRLLRLPQNSGKGAAVMAGMREARAAGFSHALQVDADGQHDSADVPRFLERAAAKPGAVICGTPLYDASVPKGRLYGRYLTHVWVWIETLSFAIRDSMCGFRMYPLDACCDLADAVRLPARMAFDTEILVRLHWRGVEVENLPTRVRYPEDGVSHFDMLNDNLRITAMHTRLVFGMLLRLPLLIGRKLGGGDGGVHWSRIAERGSLIGLQCVFACYRLLGERAAHWLLYPVVAYFFVTGSKARAASLDYLRRVGAAKGASAGGARTGWRQSFAHMLAFGDSGLDKLAAWMGRIDVSRIDFPNREEFLRLLASGRGALLIGSHLGNLEMSRALASTERLATVNAVVYTGHAQRFSETLARANREFGANLIQVSNFGPATAILLKEKIDRGELLLIVGDRTPPAENGRVSEVDFLGRPAPFAQGPFILASLLDCPVYLFFCLREGDGYRIHFEPFAERVELPRAEREQRLRAYIQQYARRLETYCLRAPYQWFNFYDFWRRHTVERAGAQADA